MNERKVVVWLENEPQRNTFFFRSPFKSWIFAINTVLVVVLFLGFAIILSSHWQSVSQKSSRFFWGGFCLIVGVLYPYLRALQLHSKINELYLAGKIGEEPAGSPVNAVLEVADNAINIGLLYTSTIGGLLVFLGVALLLGWLHPN